MTRAVVALPPALPRPAGLLLATLALVTLPIFAEPTQRPGPPFLDRLETRLQRELAIARGDRQENETTLAASQALLERARAAKDQAAVAAAERAISVATQALVKNKQRERRILHALGWITRLRQESASTGPFGAFLPRVDGTVEVQPSDGGPTRRLSGDVPPVAGPGDTVKTGPDGRADLLLPNGGLLNLDAGTALTLLDEGLELLFGRIRLKLEQKAHINTPTAVLGIRGTGFIVRSLPGSPDAVVVFEGQVAFSDIKQTKTVLVNAGQQSYILPDGLPAEPSKANLRDMARWWEEER